MSSRNTLTVEQPQPILRRKSVFQRFTRKERPETSATDLTPPSSPSSMKPQPPPARKLQRRICTSMPTTPSSPQQQHQHMTRPGMTNVQPSRQIKHGSKMSAKLLPTRRDSAHDLASSNESRRVQVHAMPSLPFSSTPSIGPWNLFLPPAQVHSLYLGYLPRSLSDKWFIYSEGPDASGKLKVHFHRSWTGMKMAELFVVLDVKGEGAGKVVGIKWNGGWETNRMNEAEAKFAVRGAVGDLGVELEQDA